MARLTPVSQTSAKKLSYRSLPLMLLWTIWHIHACPIVACSLHSTLIKHIDLAKRGLYLE